MQPSLRTCVGLILVVVLLGAAALWIGGPPDPSSPSVAPDFAAARNALNTLDLRTYTPNRGDREVRRILLVTVDTLRADHLPSYGYPLPTAPFLSDLAKESVQFERAFAPMSTTSPSHASLLTALYPLQHGVLSNMKRMGDTVLTLPEMLQRQGFSTAGFVSTNRHFRAANLDQGFEVFDEPDPAEEIKALNHRRRPHEFHYRSARPTIRRALEWFASQPRASSYFVWIHLFDPHMDWAYRPKYYSALRVEGTERRRWIHHVERVQHVDLTPGAGWFGDASRERMHAYRLYDAEIRYVDRALKTLFDGLDALRARPQLSIVTADHGEGMGNHGWWRHARHIYNEQIRVPLFVHWRDGRFEPRRVRTVVELNDLAPTILRAGGVPREVLATRRLPLEGEPLQDLLNDSRASSFGYAFAQRRIYRPISTVDRALDRLKRLLIDPADYPFGEMYGLSFKTEIGQKYSLLDGRRKLIHATAFPDRLYDLQNDFYEQNNRIDRDRAAARRLGGTLYGILDRLQTRSLGKGGNVDEASVEGLRGLGYTR